MKKFRSKGDLYKYLDQVLVSNNKFFPINSSIYHIVNIPSEGKVLSSVLLASNSLELKRAFDEEFS